MKRSMSLAITVTILALGAMVSYAQEDPSNVLTPAFKPISSKTMTLKYGFKGASVYDNADKKWHLYKMTTITRSKVEGFVNQVNDNFALAAGLHEVAVYDFNKHKWFIYKNGGCDDSTGGLKTNFEMTADYVKVKILNGPWIRYAPNQNGWAELGR